MSFKEVLGRLMKDTGTSAKKLGESIGVSDVIVGRWMKGESIPNLNNAKSVADYFDISLDVLAGGEIKLDAKAFSKLPILGEAWASDIHIYGLPKGEYIFANNSELDGYTPSECYCIKFLSANPINPHITYLYIHQQTQCENGDYVVYQQMDALHDESGVSVDKFSLRKFVRTETNIELQPISEYEKNIVFRKQDINLIHIQGVVINAFE